MQADKSKIKHIDLSGNILCDSCKKPLLLTNVVVKANVIQMDFICLEHGIHYIVVRLPKEIGLGC